MAVKLFVCSSFVLMEFMYLAATIRLTVAVLTYKQYHNPEYTEVRMELDR
jgi:hypothetical protein